MAMRESSAVWTGDLKGGSGNMRLGSGAYEGSYSFATRFEDKPGTNPEELIAAAHAGCFSMALAAGLSKAGMSPREVRTTARVKLEKQEQGFAITGIELETEARVEGASEEAFLEQANAAKGGCPVSKALAAVPITLKAKLLR